MSKLILSEFSQKGADIYNTRIKHELPPGLKGKIVAIEVESGDYFIGDTPLRAGICGQKKHPNKQFYFKRIGYDTVYRILRPFTAAINAAEPKKEVLNDSSDEIQNRDAWCGDVPVSGKADPARPDG